MVPTEIVEPGVRLELACAIVVADAIHWLALQALVDEISRSFIPACGDVGLLDGDLAEEDLISNVLPRAPFIGTLSHHALVGDNAHGEVIRRQPVVLPAHDLRRHIAWRAAGLAGVVW